MQAIADWNLLTLNIDGDNPFPRYLMAFMILKIFYTNLSLLLIFFIRWLLYLLALLLVLCQQLFDLPFLVIFFYLCVNKV